MGSLATRRLIEASATLPPADRALLNMWVNRGLDDDRLAALTRMPPDMVRERRDRVVERLAEALGLPPADVTGALDDLARTSRDAAAPPQPGLPRAAPEPPPEPAPEPPASAPEPPPGRVPRRWRRHRWLAALLLLVAAAVAVLLIAGGGRGREHPHDGPAARAHPDAAGGRAVTTTAAVTTAPTPASAPAALTALPGGLTGTDGSAQLERDGSALTLHLTVTGLPPPPRSDRYVAWLYNSVLDSEPLGTIAAGTGAAAYRLPPDAAAYRWIDISLQPAGDTNHSGASQLRAPNPAHRP